MNKFFSKFNNFKELDSNNFFLWLSLYIFLALPLDMDLLPENYQYLQSQSYTVALSIFFLIISIFFYCLNNQLLIVKKFKNNL